jgi:hypothetical protein
MRASRRPCRGVIPPPAPIWPKDYLSDLARHALVLSWLRQRFSDPDVCSRAGCTLPSCLVWLGAPLEQRWGRYGLLDLSHRVGVDHDAPRLVSRHAWRCDSMIRRCRSGSYSSSSFHVRRVDAAMMCAGVTWQDRASSQRRASVRSQGEGAADTDTAQSCCHFPHNKAWTAGHSGSR